MKLHRGDELEEKVGSYCDGGCEENMKFHRFL